MQKLAPISVAVVAAAEVEPSTAFIAARHKAGSSPPTRAAVEGAASVYQPFQQQPTAGEAAWSVPFGAVLSGAVAVGLVAGIMQPPAHADDVGVYRASDSRSQRAANRRADRLKEEKKATAVTQIQSAPKAAPTETPTQQTSTLSAPAMPDIGSGLEGAGGTLSLTAGATGLGSMLLLAPALGSGRRSQPSLLSAVEENGLLGTVQNTKLLSTAEKLFPKPLTTLERSGLVGVVEQNKLLSTLENVVLDGKTPRAIVFFGFSLLGAALYLQTGFAPVELFGNGLLSIGLGVVGALVTLLGLAAFQYLNAWQVSNPSGNLTLVKCIEGSELLSFAANNQLLSRAEGAANGALLQTVESSGLLTTAQNSRLIAKVENPLVALAQNKVGLPLALLGLTTLLSALIGATTTDAVWCWLFVPVGLLSFAVGAAVSLLQPK
eukprot:TRINITY_DN6780_c0_g1_i2.p1 TRINITY_DN6780_c0_g1~~TRINITY_DN6780_c0_g1_i2.p1  ORF type:complete len:435 (-),score=97.80 TRINITY_DN6780_c0_g1_i2:432-1736(-)